MKLNKNVFYIILFGLLWLITAFSSFFHAVEFFELSNVAWMGVILALAFEIGQASVLMSMLTSKKDQKRATPWILMCILTLVQIIGNVYSSYKYIMINSPENLKYFKEPIFIWTDLPDAEATVIVTYVSAAILPLVALLMTSMITNYLTDQSEEMNNPIELDGPPEGEGLSDQQVIERLNVTIDKRDEEIDKLKKELEELKHPKTISQSDNELIPVQSIENIEDEPNSKSNDLEDVKEQTAELEIDKSEDKQDNGNDENEQLVEKKEIEKLKRPSHFINL